MFYKSLMNTRQMDYFTAVAEELNFRKAAERLHMTQPPLSQQIAALEEELGVALFVRNRRKVELTAAGRSLYLDVQGILAGIRNAERRATDTGLGKAGRLRIGFIGPAIDGPLPDDIMKFKTSHPGVAVELHELTTAAQLDMLRGNRLDAGIVRLVGNDATGLESFTYHRESYILAVPDSHPLARRNSVSLSELDGEPLIMFPRHINPVLHDAWAAAFSNAGAHMHVAQEAITKHSSVALAAAGHGLTPVPESTASSGRHGVSFVRFEGAVPSLEFHLAVQRTDRSPALESFMRLLCPGL